MSARVPERRRSWREVLFGPLRKTHVRVPAAEAPVVAPAEPRWTRQEVEDHLASDLLHWLPRGGEAGDTPEQRARAARAAARIIAGRLGSDRG